MSYTPIPDGALLPGKFLNTSLMFLFRDNPLDMFAGDPAAPALSPAALRWQCELFHYDRMYSDNAVDNGSGSFTWTCPAGVTAVLIEGIGGGGGGGGGYSQDYTVGANGAAGSASTFDGTTMGSGGGGGQGGQQFDGGTGGSAGTTSGLDGDLDGRAGTQVTGWNPSPGAGVGGDRDLMTAHGGRGGVGGTPSVSIQGTGGKGGQDVGGGGGGGGASGVGGSGGGGGSGSYGRNTFVVVPSQTYTIQVGAGGAGGAGQGAVGRAGGAGGTYREGGDGIDGQAVKEAGGGGGGAAGMIMVWFLSS